MLQICTREGGILIIMGGNGLVGRMGNFSFEGHRFESCVDAQKIAHFHMDIIFFDVLVNRRWEPAHNVYYI